MGKCSGMEWSNASAVLALVAVVLVVFDLVRGNFSLTLVAVLLLAIALLVLILA